MILARCLDKGRAVIAGSQGEYHFACPLDQRFLQFVGVDPEGLRSQLAAGKGDQEILEWVEQTAKIKRGPWEITAWSDFQEKDGPGDIEFRNFFNQLHGAANSKREDVYSLFDLLDLDDYVSFGGKA